MVHHGIQQIFVELMMATPKQTDPQFKLRLTLSLKDAIEQAAQENNRSMNAEIVARLEASLDAADQDKLNAARSVIQGLIAAFRDDTDVAKAGARYRALLFLSGAPIKALDSLREWSSSTLREVADSFKSDLAREVINEIINDAIDRELLPIADFMRARGWRVSSPPTPFDDVTDVDP